MRAELHIDDEHVARALKESSRELNRGVKEGLRRGAETKGLPRARLLAPGQRIRSSLTAGATTRTAFLQADLRKAPEAGLLEFGGTVREPIFPKQRGGALRTPWGPRAAVYKARHYRGRHFLERAVEQTRAAVEEVAGEEIVKVYQRAGLEVD